MKRKLLLLLAAALLAMLAAAALAEGTLTVSDTEVLTYEPFTYSISIPGAESVMLYDNQWPNEDWQEPTKEIVMDQGGEHLLFAVGTMPDGSTVHTNTVTVNVLSPNGPSPLPRVTKAYNNNRTVTFTFQPMDQEASVWVNDVIDVETGENLLAEAVPIDGTAGGTFTTPRLTAGKLYRLWAWVHCGSGWSVNNLCVDFFAPGSVSLYDDSITLLVNGSDGDRSGTFGEWLDIDISAPGATVFAFWNGESIRYEYADENGHAEFREQASSGTCALTARATTQDPEVIDGDWESASWGAWCAPVTVTNAPVLANPQIVDIDAPATVARGDVLEIHLSGIDMDLAYSWGYQAWLEYYAGEGEGCAADFANDGFDTLYLSTADVEPGEYLLVIYGGAIGQPDYSQFRPVTVTEPSAGSPLHLSVSKTDAVVGENLLACLYAPGMASTAIGWSRNFENEDEYPEVYDDEFYNAWLDVPWEEGGYEIVAKAWDAAGQEYEQRATVTATSLGNLDAPAITAPTRIAPGEDFTFSFTGVENAGWYPVWLWPKYEGAEAWQFDAEEPGTYTVPADFFEDGVLYQLSISAYGTGYISNETQHGLLVQNDPVNPGYTLTLEKSEVLTSERFCFCVDAPGATAMRWRSSDWDGQWENRDGTDFWVVEGCRYDNPGTYLLQVMLCYDEEFDWENDDWDAHNWTEPSAPLAVQATAYGRLDAPELTMPSTVKQGNRLNVTVGAVEHADSYEINLKDPDSWDNMYSITVNEAGTVPMLTGNLTPGNTYTVEIVVRGEGYIPSYAYGDFICVSATGSLIFNIDDGPYTIGTSIGYSIVAPGAVKVELLVRDADQDRAEVRGSFDQDSAIDWFDTWTAGDAKLAARATFADGSTKMAYKDITLESLGQLGTPTVTAPSVIAPGESLQFTFTEVEGAGWYNIWVEPVNSDRIYERDYEHAGTYTIPASLLGEGVIYTVHVGAWQNGWEGTGDGSASFAVQSSPVNPEYSFTLENENLLVNETAHFIIDAPGATAMRWRDSTDWGGDGSPDHWNDWWDEDYFELHRDYDEPGKYILQIMLSYDEGFDWENDDWDAHNWTSPDTLGVTVTMIDRLPDVELSAPASVKQGNVLNVTFTGVDHVASYDAVIHDPETWDDMYRVSCEPGTVPLLTGNLTPGKVYTAEICAFGEPGYHHSFTFHDFSVLEPAADKVTLNLEEGPYYIGKNFQFSITAPGAARIQLLTRDANQDKAEVRREYEGDSVIDSEAIWAMGTAKVVARAYYPDGTSKTSTTLAIEVGSYGTVDAPSASMNRSIYAGEWLGVTVDSISGGDGGGLYVNSGENGCYIEEVYPGEWYDMDTSSFEPGYIYVDLLTWPYPGWEGSSASYTVRVVDPENNRVLNLPAGLQTVGEEAFLDNDSADIVYIGDQVTAIESRAFAGMDDLSFVYMGSNVTSIADDAFDGCEYVVFEVPENSYACQWARDHGIGVRAY